MEKLISFLNDIIWSNWLVGLCLITGLYFSLTTRFLQLRQIPAMLRYLFKGKESASGLSSFQAFALAASGRVGTGNIVGVATAIAMGGPGAVFWMWVIAFLGAGSAFAEAALAQIYKTEIDGEYRGGPAYYIEKGLGVKWYAVIFALSTILATGLLLPSVQSNSIGAAMNNAFGVNPAITGVVIVVLLGAIIFGGVHRIGHVAQLAVPFMAIGYILVAFVVIGANISLIPATLLSIVKNAFGMDAALGGMLGAAIQWGVKRGIYSNEAGQGTAPIAAATAEVDHPAKQGLVQAFSVYVDTWFVCTATALMILITDSYNVFAADGSRLIDNIPEITVGPAFTQNAVDSVLPGFGSPFIAIALLFFAFTTLLAYYYYTESNLMYLIKSGPRRTLAKQIVRILFIGLIYYGTIKSAKLAWAMGDVGVGLMAWVNIIAILLLSPTVFRCLKDFEGQQKAGKDPVFDPEAAQIKNASFWKKP
ncbi:alanine/glycine:cation symporter family protein [Pelagicoccus sp. SDUM812003]|uniref:alanine/glycine:cation symporter family protein n=1 Tax=Pelagicoccus sp. SDUM812003 TaxID=3041267 RepID=UPI00280CDB55|nr:alanine/glycine:cation symporter family protein [Pelagicoccus sp. SDUM812003]MDQ8201516.1 alanine/glycine:cation symporter family protein [Pelagicoccus sp. SDUM812003]